MKTEQIEFRVYLARTRSAEFLVPEDDWEEQVLFDAISGAWRRDGIEISRYDPGDPGVEVSPDEKAVGDGVFLISYTPDDWDLYKKTLEGYYARGYVMAVVDERAINSVTYQAYFPVEREGERVHVNLPASMRGNPQMMLNEEPLGLDQGYKHNTPTE